MGGGRSRRGEGRKWEARSKTSEMNNVISRCFAKFYSKTNYLTIATFHTGMHSLHGICGLSNTSEIESH